MLLKVIGRSAGWSAVLACAAAAMPAPAAPAPEALDVREIVRRTLAQERTIVERRKVFDYRMDLTREILDRDGRVTRVEKEAKRYRAGTREGFDVGMGSQDEAAGTSGSDNQVFSMAGDYATLAERFHYQLEGTETIHGHACYKIRYIPKPDQPYRTREEKVFNRLTGTMLVSKETFTILLNEGHLSEPTSVAWFFATAEAVRFRSESQRLPNGDFGPAKVDMEFTVSHPFGILRERHVRRLSDYRLAGDPKRSG